MNHGDLVTRKSYGGDIIFKIESITGTWATLRGVDYRLLADSPVQDLTLTDGEYFWTRSILTQPQIIQSIQKMEDYRTAILKKAISRSPGPEEKGYFELPGKVLHLDGDPSYLQKCMSLYKQLRIPVKGYYVAEASMAEALYRLLPEVLPDIVVITGHDGIIKHRRDVNSLNSYKNSHNFVNAVKVARQYERNLDSLTVIAGACQSHFEALVEAGANFASSPDRILIHALDPLCIAAKFAYTSVRDSINIPDVINMTVSGVQGIGGIESTGCYRIGLPKVNYSVSV